MTTTTPDHVPGYAADWPPVPTPELPPAPRWPALVQSMAFMRYRHAFVPWPHRKYGDVFTVRLIPDCRQVVMFSRPEHVTEIFAGDPEVLYAGKGHAVLGAIMGEHSLLLVDVAEHKRVRKLLMPETSLNDAELRDQLVTLLLAGHETTATRPLPPRLRGRSTSSARPRSSSPVPGRQPTRATTPTSRRCSRSRCDCIR